MAMGWFEDCWFISKPADKLLFTEGSVLYV